MADTQPTLTISTLAALTALSLAYPLALYTTAHTRASQTHPRDHPQGRAAPRVLRGDARASLAHIWAVRDYVCAPITEEVVYTALLVTVAGRAAETNPRVAYVYLPLLFGVAHVHHAYERYTSGGERQLFPLVCGTLVQTAYTALFGAITNYTYLHTGRCLWACVLQHALCNMLGLPGGSEVVQHCTVVRVPASATARRLVALWGKAYLLLLPLGVLLFVRELRAWAT